MLKCKVRVPIECYNSLIAGAALRADRPDLASRAAQKIREAGFELDAASCLMRLDFRVCVL